MKPELIELRFAVAERHDGWRLDRFVHDRVPRLSRSRIQKVIQRQPAFGGTWSRPAMRVRAGQEVVLIRPAPDEPPAPRTFTVVHEDEALLAIDKPAGLVVHPTARFIRNTLTEVLRERYGDAFLRLAHRLDRETSGLMLLAKTAPAEIALKHAFERREVHKRYTAIVDGDPGESGTIDAPIGPDDGSAIRVRQAITPRGLDARTHFSRLGRRGGITLVEARPETGRQHQIRVHLAHVGAPIVGDKLYGPDPTCLFEYYDTGWTDALAERLHLPRHALHASGASFPHPVTGDAIDLTCPLPDDLAAFWARAGGSTPAAVRR